ncbi:MAG TPA: NADH-quinone oxidoreductase subunit H, partial [Aggregatilinea sp.]|uniref:complex I subunit 1/NuoH family protein n=1 Tax=Aggregatilinea sp. TaxID=2806333 RepID=UPI002CCCBC29
AGTLNLSGIVEAQNGRLGFLNRYFLPLFPMFVIFYISALAETNRPPFDLVEAESELVAGYMTEYSGMKFGMFYVGEFLHAFTFSVLTAIFFLGGWKGPFAEDVPLLGLIYLIVKAMFAYFAMMWIRMTFPRVEVPGPAEPGESAGGGVPVEAGPRYERDQQLWRRAAAEPGAAGGEWADGRRTAGLSARRGPS